MYLLVPNLTLKKTDFNNQSSQLLTFFIFINCKVIHEVLTPNTLGIANEFIP